MITFAFRKKNNYIMSKYLFIGFLTLTIWTSCYYDVEEDLYNTQCDTAGVGFAADVSPLITAQCLQCHSAASAPFFGNVNLETYNDVKVYVDNGKFIGSIRHDSGYSPMPQGQAKFSSCNISKIEKWIADGALNN